MFGSVGKPGNVFSQVRQAGRQTHMMPKQKASRVHACGSPSVGTIGSCSGEGVQDWQVLADALGRVRVTTRMSSDSAARSCSKATRLSNQMAGTENPSSVLLLQS